MTIKKKLWLSNIMMVAVPMAVSFLTVAAVLQTSFGGYWNCLQRMYKDENGILSAQSLIYTYQQELWEYNWSQRAQDCQTGDLRRSSTMYDLEEKLNEMGYHILVKKNGNILYSDISDADMETAVKTAGEALYTAKSLTAGTEHVSVIKNTFYHEAKEFSIIAVCTEEKLEVESYLHNYIMKYFFCFLAMFVLLTILVNWLLSHWISRSVLIPLNKLRQGTQRIIEGDLDEKLESNGGDEFAQVIGDFEEMRKYLKESVAQRLENERRKKEMISGISHDLRTPLTSIAGYVDGLMEGIADTPKKQKRYLGAIRTRTNDLQRLVDSLSEYNCLDSGKGNVQMNEGDLKSFMEGYLAEYEEEAGNKKVTIRLHAHEGSYGLCYDEKEMRRVMEIYLPIRFDIGKNRSHWWISGWKKKEPPQWSGLHSPMMGRGVQEESLERIFEAFYRTDSARSHAGEGSGIGLAVVKEIIERYGGHVSAENRGGLAIVIELPFRERGDKGE